MAEATVRTSPSPAEHAGPSWLGQLGRLAGILIVLGGMAYCTMSLVGDVRGAPGSVPTTVLPFILLIVALLIALGFEFVNGFHDTANAVATVIYTHALPAYVAVVWSGFFNFLGVLLSSGLVAFTVVSLLPVELILQVGSSAGYAMVFALLIAAIIWNVGTWYFGIPNSSSHALIGSIIGVGVANGLMATSATATSGVDWSQALGVGRSLLFSPVAGFFLSGLVLLIAKVLLPIPKLYQSPVGNQPPPWWIRGLLILTCTGVSFAHGSNDGQKGMGLIMLILIGTVPAAYALNRAMPAAGIAHFLETSAAASRVIESKAAGYNVIGDPRPVVTAYVARRELTGGTIPALAVFVKDIAAQVKEYGALNKIPSAAVQNTRNDMYLASEALRLLVKDKRAALSATDIATLSAYQKSLDNATKFIPTWVKVAVAIALGLGTMVGWRRIVVTVGERIGKQHLAYAQGASAELVAMGTIFAADVWGLPVSTTHILSSGVAGTMAANRSGLQWSTIMSLLSAWVMTLPVSIVLAGVLFFIFRHLF